MNSLQIDQINQLTQIDLSNPNTLKKLTSSLAYLFRFGSQSELPFILGYPETDNNQQALTLWITDTLKTADWIEPDHLLEYLVTELKHQLIYWQEVA